MLNAIRFGLIQSSLLENFSYLSTEGNGEKIQETVESFQLFLIYLKIHSVTILSNDPAYHRSACNTVA